jgi:diaminopimelate epimerase
MRVPFLKMHGCGNDFVLFDARAERIPLTPAIVRALADRRRGIGCDQLIELRQGRFMRIWNADGTESGTCGNATRCVAALIAAETGERLICLTTSAGRLTAEMQPDGTVSVDMGSPGLAWQDIPLARVADTLRLPLVAAGLPQPAAASMGNPHVTFFVDDVEALDIAAIGPGLEHHKLFPQRANIGFAQILAPDRIRLRVWERGAGLTLACGSGACAALVNAFRRGLTGRRAQVVLDGGTLDIAWNGDGHVLMTGPVATSFTGQVDLPP